MSILLIYSTNSLKIANSLNDDWSVDGEYCNFCECRSNLEDEKKIIKFKFEIPRCKTSTY